jgi:LysM repeat protein
MLFSAGVFLPCAVGAQSSIASLEQDVLLLREEVGRLRMTVEELQRQQSQAHDILQNQSYVTLDQLTVQLNQLKAQMESSNAAQRNQIVSEVSRQMEAMGRETQAAINVLSKNTPSPTKTAVVFTQDYPKEGISYTVKSGDTLSMIARQNNSTVKDIQNANQITDPTRINVGQVIFIPQKQN